MGERVEWKEAERGPGEPQFRLVQFVREHAAALAGPLSTLVLFDANVKPQQFIATTAPEQVEPLVVREAPAYWAFVSAGSQGLDAELGSPDVVFSVTLPPSSDRVVRRGSGPHPSGETRPRSWSRGCSPCARSRGRTIPRRRSSGT